MTAPEEVAAEALFDPAAFDGVSATSTAKLFVGAGSPSTTAVGPIKWKSGTLSVELTPAASFSGTPWTSSPWTARCRCPWQSPTPPR